VRKLRTVRADSTAVSQSALRHPVAPAIKLGEVLITEGLITEEQLREALEFQRTHSSYVPLGQILLQQKLLTANQLNKLLDRYDLRPKLGELLVRNGAISQGQLDYVLSQQQKKRTGHIGQILVKLGYIDDDTMRQALGVQLNIPFLDLDRMTIDPGLTRLINYSYAKRHSMVPVSCVGQVLTVCMDDPTNRLAVEELSRSSAKMITVVTASRAAISRAFERLYKDKKDATPTSLSSSSSSNFELITEEDAELGKSRYSEQYTQTKKADVLVRKLLTLAIQQHASDIHIETLASRLQVRARIDGVLEPVSFGDMEDLFNQSPREIVSRLKILGKLDIAERRRPQDGSFRVRVSRDGQQTPIDLRVSVVPSYHGESVVLRLLDRRNAPKSIDQLNFPAIVGDRIKQLVQRPSGIILVTGPTGSGKSTTLYAALMTLYRPQIRVLTAEDPIEYVYEQFSQSEVNAQIGNTFASYLRSFLRHDPEVILVGEIRDEETAEMAFRAAQTGHLLLSTLHTETAVGAVSRLLDLKIDANTLTSSLNAVIGQRLVREICKACRAEYMPHDELLCEFFSDTPALTFYRGQGCAECNYSGYRGRMTIVELWIPTQEDIVLITKSAPFDQIRAQATRNMYSMAENIEAALAGGRTNLEELVRVLPYAAISDFRQRKLGTAAEAPEPELVA
jgi:type IV pilus assembly protein PilB